MEKYFIVVLVIPLYIVVMFSCFDLINKTHALILWLSFFVSSLVYAITADGLLSSLTIPISIAILNLITNSFLYLKKESITNKKKLYIAIKVTSDYAMFSDGLNVITKQLLETEKIKVGKIYNIQKIN